MADTRQEVLKNLLFSLGPRNLDFGVVEIGVASGRTSEFLLSEFPNLHLTMVDIWEPPPYPTRKTQESMDQALRDAQSRTDFASQRRNLVQGRSVIAAHSFEGDEFDLVFIDANHVLEYVLSDCAAWWSRVKRGGIMCGHDINSRKDDGARWGVRLAVMLFSDLVGVPFEVVEKEMWVMRKV